MKFASTCIRAIRPPVVFALLTIGTVGCNGSGQSLSIVNSIYSSYLSPYPNFSPLVGITVIGLTAIDVGDDGVMDLAVSTADAFFLDESRGLFFYSDDPMSNIDSFARVDGFRSGSRLITGDLNNDSLSDIVGLGSGDSIRVALQTPQGTFQFVGDFLAFAASSDAVIEDFDLDGFPDVVTVNGRSGTIGFLRGNGDGTLERQVSTTVGSGPQHIAIADLNGDALPDLIVTPGEPIGLQGVINRGDHFELGATIPTDRRVFEFIMADMNNDGLHDLVLDQQESLAIKLSTTLGNFATAMLYDSDGIDSFPGAKFRAADLDNDGALDIVSAGDVLEVFLGQGDGTVLPAQTVGPLRVWDALETGDFDLDGNIDIAVASEALGNVTLFRGNGDGTFTDTSPPPPPSYAVGNNPLDVALNDLNNDGILDIITGNRTSGDVSVLLGFGDGTFAGEIRSLPVGGILSLDVGDFNRDGNLDIFTGTRFNGAFVLIGNGDGTLSPGPNFDNGNRKQVAAADVNSDGILDVLATHDTSISFALGTSTGSLEPPQTLDLDQELGPVTDGPVVAGPMAVGDLDGDGIDDVVVAGADAVAFEQFILFGDVAAPFTRQNVLTTTFNAVAVQIADTNLDGIPDIVTANGSLGLLVVVQNDGSGDRSDAFGVFAGPDPLDLAIGDANADDVQDLFTINGSGNEVLLILGEFGDSFELPLGHSIGFRPGAIAVGDLNGDGQLDVVTANPDDDNVSVLLHR